MTAVTHRILMDLKETMTRAGALAFGATMATAGSSISATSSAGNTQNTRRDNIIKELKAAGYNDTQVAGIIGNLHQESHFNPTTSYEGHYGIAQWDETDRWPKIKKWIESQGGDPNNEVWQTKALIWEMQNEYNLSPQNYNVSNVNNAVDIFESVFEKSGRDSMQNRYKYGNEAAAAIPNIGLSIPQQTNINAGNDSFRALKGDTAINRTLPLYAQTSDWDCTPTSVAMMSTAYTGRVMSQSQGVANWTGGISTSLTNAGVAHDEVALNSVTWQQALSKLQQNSPVMLYYDHAAKNSINRGSGSHGVVLARINSDGTIRVHDPNQGIVHNVSQEELTNNFGSNIYLYIPHDTVNVTNFSGGAGNTPSFGAQGGFSTNALNQWTQLGLQYLRTGNQQTLAQMYEAVGLGSVAEQEALLQQAKEKNEAFDIAKHSPLAESNTNRQHVIDEEKRKQEEREKNTEEEKKEDNKSTEDSSMGGIDNKSLEATRKANTMDSNIFTPRWLNNTYTGNIDTTLYEERRKKDKLNEQIQQWTDFYKKYEHKIIQPPKELSQKEFNALSKDEQKKYLHQKELASFQELSQEEIDALSEDEKKEYLRKKKELTLTDIEARDLAEKQVHQIALQDANNDQLLQYFGISAKDEQTNNQIAELLRLKTDFQGNEITQEYINQILQEHNNWTEDQAISEIMRITNTNSDITFKQDENNNPVTGQIHQLLTFPKNIDWVEASKKMPELNIKHSDQKTNTENIEVSGYEAGKKVHFYTNEEDAFKFYHSQEKLFAQDKEFIYQQSPTYIALRNQKLKELGLMNDKNEFLDSSGNVVPELDKITKSKVNADVYQSMTSLPEFNMTGKEYAQLLGIQMDPNARSDIYEMMLKNAQLGLSPSGVNWQEDVVKETNRLKDMLENNRAEDQNEIRGIKQKLERLNNAQIGLSKDLKNTKQTLENQLSIIAKSNLLHNKPDEYGKISDDFFDRPGIRGGTLMDENGNIQEGIASFKWSDYENDFDILGGNELRTRQSYLSQNPMMQMYLHFQHSNPFYGETNANTYGGLSSSGIAKSLMNVTNPDGTQTRMLNWDLNEWERQIALARERAVVLSTGGERRANMDYGRMRGNVLVQNMDKSITGMTVEGQAEAERDRLRSVGKGILKDQVKKGHLEIEQSTSKSGDLADTSKVKTTLTIKGHLTGLNEQATKALIEAIQDYIKNKGLNADDLVLAFDGLPSVIEGQD